MRPGVVACAVLLAGQAVLCAQDGDAARAQADLSRSQRELQQNRAEVERLIEMRLRHDLGLPVEEDGAQFRSTTPATTEDMERARMELRDQDAATAMLLERYNKLKAEVDQLQAEAQARTKAAGREREFVVVPPANSAQDRRPVETGQDPAAAAPGAEAALPAPAVAPAVPRPAIDLGLDPVRGQIHGSQDHQRVAQSLFKAGQVLMDRAQVAREQGQDEAAREFDVRAKERLVRAVEELAPLLRQDAPSFQALFYLGRCRELLFRLSQRYDNLSLAASTREYQRREQEVREPFLAIASRDVRKQGERGEVEVLGPWGMAAQTAMEHFRWMNLHGGYDPRATIEALTWPGERAQ